jgi:hypothetical protein
VSRILAGLRLPTAQFADGRIVVLGAFDAVYWTEDVASYEAALHALLPAGSSNLELWLSGALSPRARSELSARGWDVHDNAAQTIADPARAREDSGGIRGGETVVERQGDYRSLSAPSRAPRRRSLL